MRKFIFPAIIVAMFIGLFTYCAVLSSRCYVLREKQALPGSNPAETVGNHRTEHRCH